MGHATVENRTPFAFATLFTVGEDARPVVVTLVKATYEIMGRQLVLAEKQPPIKLDGELYGDDTRTSSYRYEPEIAFLKVATDVILLGHAHASSPGATESQVGFRLGPVQKTVAVVGERFWVKSAGAVMMTRPLPFEKIPLRWENAFGGWDHTVRDPERLAFEARNPTGCGFRARNGTFEEGVRLPSIEDPQNPLRSYGQTPPPAGFGFVSPAWQPRVALAGTYDDAWAKEQSPRLPRDFDRRFFNAAPAGLVAPGHLRGDEQAAISGVSPHGTVSFRLPGVPPPTCKVMLLRDPDATLATQLDTVIVDADAGTVSLVFRAYTRLKDGPHDVVEVAIDPGGAARATAQVQ